uniref:GABA transporter 1-like isoform X2 n=1 Tax=Erigeron canadensis TaxID=72917 RepID=UPI001CB972AD|nr:GABA transporter 1-like isoform X2 [Erigeron canadensis]
MASNQLPPSAVHDSGNNSKEAASTVTVDNDSSVESTGTGSWKHAAFHVATTIATPAAYAPLPFAVSSLGWPFGVVSLVGATLTTWYSSNLIASLWKWNGKKHTTYRHLAGSIYGSWGYWSIAFFQQVASLGNNIAVQIAAGSSLKLPHIHSLRWLNAVCTFSTIGFAGTTIGVTIYNGKKIDRGTISYSLKGSSSSKMFKAFNGLGVIAFSFGDAMLPEIQNTIREPAKKTMYKGIATAYTIIILSYWQLAFFGYWAFGTGVQPFIVASLTTPKWTIVMANLFAVIQICGCFQIYCRPTYALLEEIKVSSDQIGRSLFRIHLQRLLYTSLYMGLITLVAAAMPFFGDFVSICGAIGFTPLDFVFPVLAHLKAGKMPKNSSLIVILNIVIATWFSAVAVMGCIGAVKFIIDDVKTYKFFHDM